MTEEDMSRYDSYSETYIREEERKHCEWCEKNLEEEKRCLKRIDGLLSESTPQARQELLSLFSDQNFLKIHENRNSIVYMSVIMKIYETEINNGEEFTVLDMGTSSGELVGKLIELKFLLWKIIYAKEDCRYLLEFIHKNHVTPYMLQYLVLTASVNKKELLLQLAAFFEESGEFHYAYGMLNYLTWLFPEEESSWCQIADFCGSIGELRWVEEYLSKVKNPGEMSERIRKKYGC